MFRRVLTPAESQLPHLVRISAAQLLDRVIHSRREEDWTIDAKRDAYDSDQTTAKGRSSKGKDKKLDFLKDVASFSNSYGGVIILGLDERPGPTWELVGIDEANGKVQRLQDWLQHLEPPGAPDVRVTCLNHSAKQFIVVEVPKSIHAPVCFRDGESLQFWIRERSSNRRMSLPELERLFRARIRRIDWRKSRIMALIRQFETRAPSLAGLRVELIVGVDEDLLGSVPDSNPQDTLRGHGAMGELSSPITMTATDELKAFFGYVPNSFLTLKGGVTPIIRLPGTKYFLSVIPTELTESCASILSLLSQAGTIAQTIAKPELDVPVGKLSTLNSDSSPDAAWWILYLVSFIADRREELRRYCSIESWCNDEIFSYDVLDPRAISPESPSRLSESWMDAACQRLRFTIRSDLCELSVAALYSMIDSEG